MDELDAFLVDKRLEGGWVVAEPRHVQRDAASTSRCYIAINERGEKAFVKVLDPRANGSLEEAQTELSQFIYERDVVDLCGERKMHRVVRGLEYGVIQTPGAFPVSLHYLIFEWAESDLRSQIELDERSHQAVILRWLHHVATGLRQLHYSEITHQDLKPANILVMPNKSAKVGDLSRAQAQATPRPTNGLERDQTYLAPELLYLSGASDFDDHCAADMYALGGVACFLATGLSLNASLTRELTGMHHWSVWKGSFEGVLPYVRRAYEVVIADAITYLPEDGRERFAIGLRELCDPDPTRRGHPENLGGSGSRYGLERYVSLFDLLATKAEWRRRRTS